jgi:osmotically-inducible protein OsmY
MRRVAVGALASAASACSLLKHRAEETPAQIAARAQVDSTIQREVEARLAAEPSIGAGRVRVSVERGEVGLYGAVAGLGALNCAERNAELVRGVKLVVDQLVLEPGPKTVRCLAPRTFPVRSAP